jgi:hypothetical protein
VGYVVWLWGVTVLVAVVPVPYMIFAGSVFLLVMVVASLFAAHTFSRSGSDADAGFFLWAPALPIAASLYSVIVVLTFHMVAEPSCQPPLLILSVDPTH